jgi:hypothetical protein
LDITKAANRTEGVVRLTLSEIRLQLGGMNTSVVTVEAASSFGKVCHSADSKG